MSDRKHPSILDPLSWPTVDRQYGYSPALEALAALKAFNELPREVRIEAAARFVEQQINQRSDGQGDEG